MSNQEKQQELSVSRPNDPSVVNQMETKPIDEESNESSVNGLNTTPHASQIIHHEGKVYTTVKEGLAHILVPQQLGKKSKSTNPRQDGSSQSVFYNPIQQFNRDLSVLAIRAFGEDYLVKRKAEKDRKHERGQRGKKRKRGDSAKDDLEKEIGDESATKRPANRDGLDLTDTSVQGLTEVPTVNGDSGAATESTNTGDSKTPITEAGGVSIPNEISQPTSTKYSFSILDALSATGLRALRYAHEIPFATSITANDLSPSATESINLNIIHNSLVDKIVPSTGDARSHMYSGKKYQVIDLDPYGTAAPFFDSALQAIGDNGLLAVTCTDAGVFASNGYPEKAYALYGGVPMKGLISHEAGLRLILNSIATVAARYGLAVEPLLSLSIDYYARLFVRVHRSPADVKFLAAKTIIVHNCDTGCGSWTIQRLSRDQARENKNGEIWFKHSLAQGPAASPRCEHCGFKTHMAGPMWGGPLHNPQFISRVLSYLPMLDESVYATIPRIKGMLTTALEEDLTSYSRTLKDKNGNNIDEPSSTNLIPKLPPHLHNNHPFFLIPSNLSRILHTTTPTEASMRGALKHLGYNVGRSHTKAGSIITDAPWSVIWEIMREWVVSPEAKAKGPIGKCKEGTAGYEILKKSRPSTTTTHSDTTTPPGEKEEEEGTEASSLQQLKTEASTLINSSTSLSSLKISLEALLYRTTNPTTTNFDTSTSSHPPKGLSPSSPSTTDQAHPLPSPDPNAKPATYLSQSPSPSDLHKLKIVFDEQLGKEKKIALVRYQVNPHANWGPQARARNFKKSEE
ncbi:MAG: RNA methyltransferase tRNA(m5U54)methyltransferase [Cirrosporium novae-zelandiae]|nr:MAG: RNA methyltransferase tRNA(m5U54)methyltransferase [Cirrosporium novae-zelandiae]